MAPIRSLAEVQSLDAGKLNTPWLSTETARPAALKTV